MTYMFTTGGNRSYYDLNNYSPKETTKKHDKYNGIGFIGGTKTINTSKQVNNIPFDENAFMQFLHDIRNS